MTSPGNLNVPIIDKVYILTGIFRLINAPKMLKRKSVAHPIINDFNIHLIKFKNFTFPHPFYFIK